MSRMMNKKDWGSHGPPPNQDRASDKQLAFIERLTKWAGVGTLGCDSPSEGYRFVRLTPATRRTLA